jgi:hypothetical protein
MHTFGDGLVPVDCDFNEMLDLEIALPHGLQFDFDEGASHVCSIVRAHRWSRPSKSRTADPRGSTLVLSLTMPT